MKRGSLLLGVLASGCAATASPRQDQSIEPVGAYHQHLASPEIGTLMGVPGALFDADTLILQLDEAGIRRGVALSLGYMFGDDRRQAPDDEARTRSENDWTSTQVSRFPDRLVGICSVNPLKTYALAELDRCRQLPHMTGVKLHFGNSGVSLRNPEHLARIQSIFRYAGSRGLPLIIHFRAREGTPFGREDAEIFIRDVLPLGGEGAVQIAHLAGAGGFPDYADAAMEVFAEAITTRAAGTRNLYFDVTAVATAETTPEDGARIALRLRQVGLGRVLFGSDLPFGGNPAPRESWATFMAKTPLTANEFQDIADNVPPYMP